MMYVLEMTDPLSTHTYDGKIDSHQLSDLATIEHLSLDQKRVRASELLSQAQSLQTTAYTFLERIVVAMGTSENVDSSNNMNADDLICLAWMYRGNVEFMTELEIQLVDMQNGFCSQGRTHRLFQIILAFQYNFKQHDE